MHKLTKKNWIQLAVMTVIFLLASVLVYKTTIVTRMVMPRIESQIRAESGLYYKISSGDHIEQTFVYDKDALLSVGTQISLDEDMLQSKIDQEEKNKQEDYGTLHLQILDASGNSQMRADYEVRILDDGQNLLASFPTAQNGWEGKKLTIVLDAENIDEDLELSLGYSTKEAKGAGLSVNGETSDYTLNVQTASHQFLYWKQWALFGAVLIYLLLVGTYLGFAVFRARPEKVFLFAGSILAILYLLMIPPLAVPDEESHIVEAYYYSNILMGRENAPNDNTLLDAEDARAMRIFKATPSLSEYDDLRTELFRTQREKGVCEAGRFFNYSPAITYLPGILALTAGRLLGLNGVLLLYLGRICYILWYLFMMYWFIKLMPFGKAAAFVLSILPITIQQCCSYSYDAVVIAVAFVYLAILFQLLYVDKPIKKWQIIIYSLCIFVLSMSKGGTYLSLCLLTVLVPISRFTSRKRKWQFVVSEGILSLITFLWNTMGYVMFVAAPTAEQAAGTYLGEEARGAAGLLADPFGFLMLALRTFFRSGDGFIETMLGMQLGWLNIEVSRLVVYGMLLLMIIAVLQTENIKGQKDIVVTAGQKGLFFFGSAVSVGIVMASMFMSWTPKDAVGIEGVQGRYFLPLLPILLLLFRTQNIVVKKDISRKIMYIGVCLQCVAIYGILMSLERIL
ncbi:MAG: DUF2142 domain-containing protein [Lachnospiraceae bacterium]|nr:DUF2142 domain-containing protein [Lachnospiraceae bacterium]